MSTLAPRGEKVKRTDEGVWLRAPLGRGGPVLEVRCTGGYPPPYKQSLKLEQWLSLLVQFAFEDATERILTQSNDE